MVDKPTVMDPKLRNIVEDLYKGRHTTRPLGTGSTADAIRHELRTGNPVGGRFHSQKGREYARALEKWLDNNPHAAQADRAAAQAVLRELLAALGGN